MCRSVFLSNLTDLRWSSLSSSNVLHSHGNCPAVMLYWSSIHPFIPFNFLSVRHLTLKWCLNVLLLLFQLSFSCGNAEQSSWHSASAGMFAWQESLYCKSIQFISNLSFPSCQLIWTLNRCMKSGPRAWLKSLPQLMWDCRNQFSYFCFPFSRSFSVTLLTFVSFMLSLVTFFFPLSLYPTALLEVVQTTMTVHMLLLCFALLLPFLIHCPGFSLLWDVLCPLLTVGKTWWYFKLLFHGLFRPMPLPACLCFGQHVAPLHIFAGADSIP